MTVAPEHGLRLLHLSLIFTWVPTLVNMHFQGLEWWEGVLGSESQPFCESGLGATCLQP